MTVGGTIDLMTASGNDRETPFDSAFIMITKCVPLPDTLKRETRTCVLASRNVQLLFSLFWLLMRLRLGLHPQGWPRGTEGCGCVFQTPLGLQAAHRRGHWGVDICVQPQTGWPWRSPDLLQPRWESVWTRDLCVAARCSHLVPRALESQRDSRSCGQMAHLSTSSWDRPGGQGAAGRRARQSWVSVPPP